ncbi:hypothetical protein D3C80_2058520 [compost metagenome]
MDILHVDAYGNGVIKIVEGLFLQGYYVLPSDEEYKHYHQNCMYLTETEAIEAGYVHISCVQEWQRQQQIKTVKRQTKRK